MSFVRFNTCMQKYYLIKVFSVNKYKQDCLFAIYALLALLSFLDFEFENCEDSSGEMHKRNDKHPELFLAV